jgi:hypothetical protein
VSEYRRRLAELAVRYGRKLDLTKSHHYKLTAPGKPVVFASSSTSDPVHALKNTEALLKKMNGKDKS